MGNAINALFGSDMDGQTRQHRFRYHLAKGFVSLDDTVLDLGCGVGYGSEILSEVAGEVIAIDIDKANTDVGKQQHNRKNIEYRTEDLEKYDLPKAEVSVQFENLEHLYDPVAFANKLKKAVSGYIIVSVPFGCEKLIEVDGDIQADLDSTHHCVFNSPAEVDRLFVDETWKVFFSLTLGVTYLSIYYRTNDSR